MMIGRKYSQGEDFGWSNQEQHSQNLLL